jgi:hypothetical protein
MPAALPLALLLLAEGAAYGPEAPPAPKPAVTAAANDCPTTADPNSREIVICAQRPQGYRLDPDVIEARKEKRDALAGRLKTPTERAQVNNCSTGPNSCVPTGPNLLAVAIGAATMARRLAEGKEIGSMFETNPQPDEYHLYLAAKHRREQREAEAAAVAAAEKAKAAQAAAAGGSAKP